MAVMTASVSKRREVLDRNSIEKSELYEWSLRLSSWLEEV